MINRSGMGTDMTKMNERWTADEAKAFIAHIEKLKNEIETEKLYNDGNINWRVARVGDVGSKSWNMHMQEIDLELEKLQTRQAHNSKTDEIKRIKQLAGIVDVKVDDLATKQAKRRPKSCSYTAVSAAKSQQVINNLAS
jgi:hypothetical protein